MATLGYRLTKTLLGSFYQFQACLPGARQNLTDYTLNKKLNVFASDLPSNNITSKYFGIGINGFKNLNDTNLSAPYDPSAKNLSLYQQIPFRAVPVDDDLSDAERELYRVRTKQVGTDGNQYWCYWLKKITFTDNNVNIVQVDLTTNQQTILTGFDASYLNPTPSVVGTSDSTSDLVDNLIEGSAEAHYKTYIGSNLKLEVTGAEIIEVINALYSGNLLYAKISEIGIFMGEDKTVTVQSGTGSNFQMTEAILASLAYHYCWTGTPFVSTDQVTPFQLNLNSAETVIS